MVPQLEIESGITSAPTIAWLQIWKAAIARPTVANYQELAQQANGGSRTAWTWIVGSGLISGLLLSGLSSPISQAPRIDPGIALEIVIFATLAVMTCVLFIGCAHGFARLVSGNGTYRTLMYVCAAFNAPLLLLASVLFLVPRSGALLIALYLYWLFLYLVAVQAVHRISRVKAIGAVLLSLFLVNAAFLLALGFLMVSRV